MHAAKSPLHLVQIGNEIMQMNLSQACRIEEQEIQVVL